MFRTLPWLVPKIWGGPTLRDRLGKRPSPGHPPLEAGAAVGESWEVADLPEGQCLIAHGPLARRPLGDAVARHGAALTGGDHARFPLLVKLLDARADLSVQVHPGPEAAAGLEGARPKDECWLILEAEPDGAVLHGLRDGVTREDLAAALGDSSQADPTALLRRVPVQAGDVLRVPPGTIHAICAGVMLLEVQQPSDTTFRVWDYERPGLDGQPRPLHIDQALEVAHFGAQPAPLLEPTPLAHPGHELLVEAPAYRLERLITNAPTPLRVPDHSALIVTALEGACTLRSEDQLLELALAQTAIVPASCPEVLVHPTPEVTLALASLGR